jgi:hypothetical protein
VDRLFTGRHSNELFAIHFGGFVDDLSPDIFALRELPQSWKRHEGSHVGVSFPIFIDLS